MRATSRHLLVHLFCGLCAVLLAGAAGAADKGAPPTAVKPVRDTYGDLTLTDPYRWLERGADPAVKRWSAAQDTRARRYLDKLPQRAELYQRLMAANAASSNGYRGLRAAGGSLFVLFTQPLKQQPAIARLARDADPATLRVVVDPNALDAKGRTAIDWFEPSPDGRLLAVSMSENGSEDGALHLFDAASGKQVGPVIPRVQYPTAGGSLAWNADGSGFWYTRYPGPDEGEQRRHFYQQVYYHKLGDDPAADRYVLGRDFPKVAEIFLGNRNNPRYVVASVANGDGGDYAQYLLTPEGARQISRFEDRIVSATVGPDDALYMVSFKDAPRGKVLRLALPATDLARARVILPESEVALRAGEVDGPVLTVTQQAVYVRQLDGGPSRVAILGLDGTPKGTLPLPDPAVVEEIVGLGDGTLLVALQNFTTPRYYARYDEASAKAAPTRLAKTSPVRYDDVEVVREFATSKDGTRVPLNIVRRKGTQLDGNNPLLLYGYGGYGIALEPHFLDPVVRLWLDGGGIYVIANLRGGGEFGDGWHMQGALLAKQNVFDDFAAAAQYLAGRRYSSPARMAALGGSNGGLLMGAAITQHPELLRAVVSLVGIYDMMRVERDPNGAFNVTEFGSVKDPAQRRALYAYSPYHHVSDGARYPAILMATGVNDGRVNPMHSRKMVARLQAATASGRPVYLSIDQHAGHGIGSALTVQMNQSADVLAFLFDQLGMRLPPSSGPR